MRVIEPINEDTIRLLLKDDSKIYSYDSELKLRYQIALKEEIQKTIKLKLILKKQSQETIIDNMNNLLTEL